MAQTQLPGNQVKDNSIRNIDIASDAAIDISKLALPTSLPDKATPVDADVFTGSDSAASNVWKRFTWANIKATLKTYFDGIYAIGTIPVKATGAEIDTGTDDAKFATAKAIADQTVLLKKTGGALSGALNEAKGTDIASATTTNIGAATGNYVVVTGTTTITGLGTVQAGTRRIVTFSGVLTLTHNATSLILPTGANITTAADDTATFVSLGSGNWKCTNYQRKDGTALSAAGGVTISYATAGSDFSTSSASLVDVTNMSVNVVANKSYLLIAQLYLDAGTASDSIKFTYPSGATISFVFPYFRNNTSPLIGSSTNGYTSSPASGINSFFILGRLVVGATAGSLKLQVASGDGVSSISIKAASNFSLMTL